MTYDEILHRVATVTGKPPRPSGRGHAALCPAHDDSQASLSLSRGDDGRTLLHCHKCKDAERVARALGLTLADLYEKTEEPEWDPKRDGYAVTARYDYTDASGRLLFQKERREPKPGHPASGKEKTFMQRRPDPTARGGWRYSLGDVERPLYRLPDVLGAVASGRAVFVVEGEKDADALASLGFVATCNDGGAGTWRAHHAETLAGARVVVIPDHDASGRAHARAVCRSLLGTAAEVRLLALPSLPDGSPMPPKGDASDWLAAGGTPEALRALARSAAPYEAKADEADRCQDPGPPPIGVCVADVEPEGVRWMWPGRLTLGKVHLLDGDPGTGKSTIYASLAASLTAGAPWPDGTAVPGDARGGVVIVTAEDDVGTTIRPRLEAAGAEVSRVSVVALIPTPNGAGRMPSLPGDVGLLMGECERIGARLLILDPVTAYLGDINSHRDSDVRGGLAPLAEAAERAGVAVLLIRHLNKGAGSSALYRGGGSIAFSGLARVVLLAGRVPDDPNQRALAVAKNNLAPFPPTIGYRIESAGPFGVGRVAWLGPVPLTADDLVRPLASKTATPARDDAADYLLGALRDGPRLAREVYAEAEAEGISEKTLKRAKARLGVKAERRGGIGGEGAWYWLPPKETSTAEVGLHSAASDDGSGGLPSNGSEMPKGATPEPLPGEVVSLGSGGPLREKPGIAVGDTAVTPNGVGTVDELHEGDEVTVNVDGVPCLFYLADVSPHRPSPWQGRGRNHEEERAPQPTPLTNPEANS